MVVVEISVEIWELDLRCDLWRLREEGDEEAKEEMGKVTAVFTLTLYL